MNDKRLYAYLVGQIDDTLQIIAGKLVDGEPSRDALIEAGEKLKNALLTAEEWCLDAEED